MAENGSLYVVGIGPGSYEKMTIEAAKTLEASDVLVGYTVYIELIKEHFKGKELLSTPMTKEAERCRLALKKASEGKKVSVVCSGDGGVYGMAGLILELAAEYPRVEIHIVPGVTAALSGAALLGAPLGHDFSVISLSDRLTSMDTIRLRLECAAKSDMAICLYNPSSKARKDYLRQACEIVLRYQRPDTVCGIARNIGREGQEVELLSLEELKTAKADMFTTVYIGNSRTKKVCCSRAEKVGNSRTEEDGNSGTEEENSRTKEEVSSGVKKEGVWMVSPRGYKNV